MKRVLIIDNYDSFTYNLLQEVAVLTEDIQVDVVRNDAVDAAGVWSYRPTHLILSPGPRTPDEAGNSNAIIAEWAGRIPILGVCLGYQCIGQVFGGRIIRAPRCMHGKTSQIYHDGKTIFKGLVNPFTAMRYHSLAVDVTTLDSGFTLSAHTENKEIMGFRHEKLQIEGVQFHPESFATPKGPALLENFFLESG
ncbi:MAG: aminodeoxychorismate/anthranilate synthase component II [Sedimentisphaerales bacterium]|nr:aminodeoxychorismate/anthranilate synthase component II [Sedimentisphaerales bacterium]